MEAIRRIQLSIPKEESGGGIQGRNIGWPNSDKVHIMKNIVVIFYETGFYYLVGIPIYLHFAYGNYLGAKVRVRETYCPQYNVGFV